MPADPGRRLQVDILFDAGLFDAGSSGGAVQATARVRTLADRHRADLEAAGKGDGFCGFSVPVPPALAGREHRVELRLPDFPGARLRGTPRQALFSLGPTILRAVQPTPDDAQRLRAFLAELVLFNGGTPDSAIPGAADLRDWLATPGRCWLAAERAGRIVGHCRIGPEWPAGPEADALALGIELHPDVQGFGLGRHLMLAAHHWAAAIATRLELAVLPWNARALGLYRSLGYADLGPVTLPATGEVHRRMAIALSPQRRFDGVTLTL